MTATDPTLAALLAAVCSNPANDNVRLVLADALDEAGDSDRAEFIRVQVELATLPEPIPVYVTSPAPFVTAAAEAACRATDPNYNRRRLLRARERELWGSYPGTDDVRSYFHAVMPAAPGGWVILPASEAHHGGGGHPFAVVSRGFVSAVAAPLASLIGGRCDNACWPLSGVHVISEDGRQNSTAPARRCPVCKGTGRTPGLAPALFGCQPVTAVTAVGTTPMNYAAGHWHWGRGGNDRWSLPPELYDRLPPCPDRKGCGGGCYWTQNAAIAALSQAAVALGRSVAAGRTPL